MWETSPAGPMDPWPTGSGFEYFYGFLGGESDKFFPELLEGTKRVELPKTPEMVSRHSYRFVSLRSSLAGW